ncbi:MAG TPA: M13 family metallopeptidase N-terminal domain-containing protein, partial [Gemmatimonadaceae bacterium]|nr:M13 family metallopeptidase N-terminal domain-containing protein [Gemmatimonadaceae bacterium]
MFALGAALLASCSKPAATADTPAPAASAAAPHAPAIDVSNIDTTCAPCTNFFKFADGGWLKKTTIPPSYSRWGAFNELGDRNEAALRAVLEQAAATSGNDPKSNIGKVGLFYATCLDSTAAERDGAKP